MHTYHVTYRTPEGEERECNVQGVNHVDATAHLVELGMKDIEIVSRDEDDVVRMDRGTRAAMLALVIGVPLGLAAFFFIARRMS